MESSRPGPPEAAQWYYLAQGESHGPITAARLRQLVATGEVPADTLVWREGMVDWLSASDLGLTRALAAPVPPPVVRAERNDASSPASSGTIARHATRSPGSRRAMRRDAVDARRWLWAGMTIALVLLLAGGLYMVWNPSRHSASADANAEQERGQAVSGERQDAVVAGAPDSAATVSESTGNESVVTAAPESPAAEAANELAPATSTTTMPRGDPADDASPDMGETMERRDAAVSQREPRSDVPSPDREPTPLASGPPSVLFQEIDVQRRQVFRVMETHMLQENRYRILSRLELQPQAEDGTRRVVQIVLDTRLEQADELTRAQRQAALRKLHGQEFGYTLNARGEVLEFTGAAAAVAPAAVTPPDASGFQLVTVMDDDAWKDLVELSFLEPARHIAPGQSWTRQMSHDFEPLGSWAGTTTFVQDTAAPPPLLHFRYTHNMAFTPSGKAPASPVGVLPFDVRDMEFRLVKAEGAFVYDPDRQHVTQVRESFHVTGSFGADLKGMGDELRSLGVELGPLAPRFSIDEQQQWFIQLTPQRDNLKLEEG